MGTEKFCLRWNDFESNISVAFRELREDKDFFDVTLACEDEQLQAHKVILSACSPFFRTVLRRNPHAHPLLYLRGVKYSDLQAVLNFMYHGEVNVAQEELNSFLAVAEELKVKGLTQNNGEAHSSKPSTPLPRPPPPLSKPTPRPPPSDPVPPPKRPRPAPTDDEDIQEVVAISPLVKAEPPPYQERQETHALAAQEEEQYEEGFEDYGQYEEGGYEGEQGYGGALVGQGQKGGVGGVSEVTSPEDLLGCCVKEQGEQSKWTCNICYQFSHKSRQNVRNHVESKHYPTTFQYTCPNCDKICYTMRALEVHKSSAHRQQSSY